MNGKLFIVPTPIGNLDDITFRAVQILQEVDLILAEDTRTTGVLLKKYKIKTNCTAYHIHNEHSKVTLQIDFLRAGKNLALVSDAGTPAISDPGFLLLREAIQAGIEVCCLPGPTAFVPALVMSGLPSDNFSFYGFLPSKKGRKTKLLEMKLDKRTLVLYESPHRVIKFADEILANFGNIKVAYAREISKLHETIFRGSAELLIEHLKTALVKGEYVFILDNKHGI